MAFKDLVRANRSYRGYDESYHFTKEELADFVDHARMEPSSVNAQPFEFYLAWEKDEVDKIQNQTKWARALPDLELPHQGMHPTGFIIICQDKNISDNLNRYQKDVGIVAQTMLLDIDPKHIVCKDRLRPGKMLLVDTVKGRLVDDERLKMDYASRQPYGEWLDRNLVNLCDL